MIPPDIEEWIFPEISDKSDDAAVLKHDCGVEFQFRVEPMSGEPFLITNQHLKSWRIKIDALATMAGHNCFTYNTLDADPEGVYFDDDDNVFPILFAPATYLEHNEVAGRPLLLVISESECILTGSQCEAGAALLKKHLKSAIASNVVTIDSKWQKWIVEDEAG